MVQTEWQPTDPVLLACRELWRAMEDFDEFFRSDKTPKMSLMEKTIGLRFIVLRGIIEMIFEIPELKHTVKRSKLNILFDRSLWFDRHREFWRHLCPDERSLEIDLDPVADNSIFERHGKSGIERDVIAI